MRGAHPSVPSKVEHAACQRGEIGIVRKLGQRRGKLSGLIMGRGKTYKINIIKTKKKHAFLVPY